MEKQGTPIWGGPSFVGQPPNKRRTKGAAEPLSKRISAQRPMEQQPTTRSFPRDRGKVNAQIVMRTSAGQMRVRLPVPLTRKPQRRHGTIKPFFRAQKDPSWLCLACPHGICSGTFEAAKNLIGPTRLLLSCESCVCFLLLIRQS